MKTQKATQAWKKLNKENSIYRYKEKLLHTLNFLHVFRFTTREILLELLNIKNQSFLINLIKRNKFLISVNKEILKSIGVNIDNVKEIKFPNILILTDYGYKMAEKYNLFFDRSYTYNYSKSIDLKNLLTRKQNYHDFICQKVFIEEMRSIRKSGKIECAQMRVAASFEIRSMKIKQAWQKKSIDEKQFAKRNKYSKYSREEYFIPDFQITFVNKNNNFRKIFFYEIELSKKRDLEIEKILSHYIDQLSLQSYYLRVYCFDEYIFKSYIRVLKNTVEWMGNHYQNSRKGGNFAFKPNFDPLKRISFFLVKKDNLKIKKVGFYKMPLSEILDRQNRVNW